MEVAVLEDGLTEADMFFAHAVRARGHLNLQDFRVGLDGAQVVRHGVREEEGRRREAEAIDLAGDLRRLVVVAGEDDVRLEALDGLVGERTWTEDDREVADEDSGEPRVVLNLWRILLWQQGHLVDDSVDVVEVQLMLELVLAAVFEVIVETLDFRWFHQFRSFATDVVVTGKVNHLHSIDFREHFFESRKISLKPEVVGKRRFVDEVSEENHNTWSDMTEGLPVVSIDMTVAVVSGVPTSLAFFAQKLRICDEQNSIALVGLAGHRLPPEPLKVVDEAFVEQDDDEDAVEI